jgi:putative ABC transport system substrate-binding protein
MTRSCAVIVSRIAILSVALCVTFATAVFAQADARPDWFGYGPGIDAEWKVTSDSRDANQVTIAHRIKQVGAPGYRVLVLYPRSSSAYDIAITKILEQFHNKALDAEFTVINFEMNNNRGQEALRYAEKDNFNLIFAMGSESTAWLYDRYRGGSIPVVSVCAKDPVQLGQIGDYESGTHTNFAFTSLNVPVEVQMAYVRELKPDLRNLTVLVDSKNISAVQTQADPIAAYARQRGVQVIVGAVQDPSKARDELVQIVRRAVQTMKKSDPGLGKSLFWITGSTSVFREIQAINENADRVPVVSVVPEIVREGDDSAALAIGISFESNAILAAVYGADILTRGAKVGDLKVGIVTPPDIAINFRKAREVALRIPFDFFENASFVYDYEGRAVRPASGDIAKN